MSSLRVRNLWLLLAPAVLVALAWWQHAASSRPDRLAQVEPEAVRLLAGARAAAADAAGDVRHPDRLGPGLPLDPRAGLEHQADLFGYARQLQARVAAGDADAGWMLSRVYDYCAGYAVDPAGYAADSRALASQDDPGMAAMLQARSQLATRCAGFTPADSLSAQRVQAQRVQAAQRGSLAAEAALLAAGQPLQASEAYRRGLVQRVLASHDPEAYLALSVAMGVGASGDDAYQDYVAGDQYAELAWQVAACRLGLDCAAGSTLMTSYCANGGICSQDAGQDFETFVFDAAISRQGASRMSEMVVALINGGEVKS